MGEQKVVLTFSLGEFLSAYARARAVFPPSLKFDGLLFVPKTPCAT